MVEKLHVHGNSGNKIHLLEKGKSTTDCGIWLKFPLHYLITNDPITCKKCKSGCKTTHGAGRMSKTLREI